MVAIENASLLAWNIEKGEGKSMQGVYGME